MSDYVDDTNATGGVGRRVIPVTHCLEHVAIMHEHTTKIALMDQSISQINKSVESINANVAKLIWIVVGAIGSAGMTWILKGGMHV